MKKLLLSATIGSVLMGGSVYASITVDANGVPDAATLTDTTQVFLSGSSALQDLVENSLLNGTADGICKTGTVRKYQDAATSGSSQVAYLCELNAGTALNPVLNNLKKNTTWKSNLLLYKRNQGGSLMGTVPVANNQSIAFLNITSNTVGCSPATNGPGKFVATTSCDYNQTTNSNLQVPDFGISDVEPKAFTIASGNAPVGTAVLNTGYKTIPGVASVFGVVVTTKLRNALQEAQFGSNSTCVNSEDPVCMPSLASRQIADIFAAYGKPVAPAKLPIEGAGKIHDWTQFKVGQQSDLFSNSAFKPVSNSTKVHICGRTIGSGTKAQFGIRFLDNTCNAAGSKVVSQADYAGSNENGLGVAAAINESATRPIVHAMSSSGDLAECLDELDLDANNNAGAFDSTQYVGGRWAIGYASLDKNASRSKSYRFIKVDGVAPTIQNVANGSYHDWVESTYVYRAGSLNPLKGDALTLVNEIINSFGKPTVLSAVNTAAGTHSFGTSGFLAVPNTTHPALASGAIDNTSPVNPLSYSIFPGTGVNSTNNCRIPLVYSTPSNNDQGLQLVP